MTHATDDRGLRRRELITAAAASDHGEDPIFAPGSRTIVRRRRAGGLVGRMTLDVER